jgi:hypothetical protein
MELGGVSLVEAVETQSTWEPLLEVVQPLGKSGATTLSKFSL